MLSNNNEAIILISSTLVQASLLWPFRLLMVVVVVMSLGCGPPAHKTQCHALMRAHRIRLRIALELRLPEGSLVHLFVKSINCYHSIS